MSRYKFSLSEEERHGKRELEQKEERSLSSRMTDRLFR